MMMDMMDSPLPETGRSSNIGLGDDAGRDYEQLLAAQLEADLQMQQQHAQGTVEELSYEQAMERRKRAELGLEGSPTEKDFSGMLSHRLQEHETMLAAHRRHLDANRAWLTEGRSKSGGSSHKDYGKTAEQIRQEEREAEDPYDKYLKTAPEKQQMQQKQKPMYTFEVAPGVGQGSLVKRIKSQEEEKQRVIDEEHRREQEALELEASEREAERRAQEEAEKQASTPSVSDQGNMSKLRSHVRSAAVRGAASGRGGGAGPNGTAGRRGTHLGLRAGSNSRANAQKSPKLSGRVSPPQRAAAPHDGSLASTFSGHPIEQQNAAPVLNTRGRATSMWSGGDALAEVVRRAAKQHVSEQEALEEELAEVTGTPQISAHSEKLANRSRSRMGVSGVPIHESLLNRGAQGKAERWIRNQEQNENEVPGKPAITPRAADLDRGGPETVGDRLYKDAIRGAVDKEASQQEAQLRRLLDDNMATVAPRITKLARNHSSSGRHLHDQAVEQRKRRETEIQETNRRYRDKAHPAVNPQSELMVSRLDQGTMERLTEPKKDYSQILDYSHDRAHYSPSINRRSRQMAEERTKAMAAARVKNQKKSQGRLRARSGGRTFNAGASESEMSTNLTNEEDFLLDEDPEATEQRRLHQQQVDNLYSDAERRRNKMEERKEERQRNEMSGHTFQPTLSTNSRYETTGGPNFLERVHQWEARREQHRLETLAHEHEKEVLECSFAPQTVGPVSRQASIYGVETQQTTTAQSSKGSQQHVERQILARKLFEAKQRRKDRVFATGQNWSGNTTQVQEFNLGRHAHTNDEDYYDMSGNALAQPVSHVSSLSKPSDVATGSSLHHKKRKEELRSQGEGYLKEREEQAHALSREAESNRSGFESQSTAGRDINQLVTHYMHPRNSTNVPLHQQQMQLPGTPGRQVPQGGSTGQGEPDVSALLGLSPVAGSQSFSRGSPTPHNQSLGSGIPLGNSYQSHEPNPAATHAARSHDAMEKARAAIAKANMATEAAFGNGAGH